MELVSRGFARAKDIVPVLYADVDRALHPAAMHSVWAHLIHLYKQGRISADPGPTNNAGMEARNHRRLGSL